MAGVESDPCKLQLQSFGQEMGLYPLHARGKLPQLSSGLAGGCDSWEAAGVLQPFAEQMGNEVLSLKQAALYVRLFRCLAEVILEGRHGCWCEVRERHSMCCSDLPLFLPLDLLFLFNFFL